MKKFKMAWILPVLLVPALLQGFVYKNEAAGGDYFKVTLNGKTVTQQHLAETVALKSLSLNSSNRSDEMSFYYSHCGQQGTARVIAIKNAGGTVLKKWKFADNTAMEMQVNELLNAVNGKTEVSVYYYSKELPAGRALIKLNLSKAVLA